MSALTKYTKEELLQYINHIEERQTKHFQNWYDKNYRINDEMTEEQKTKVLQNIEMRKRRNKEKYEANREKRKAQQRAYYQRKKEKELLAVAVV